MLWVTCAVLSATSAYGVLRLAPRLRPAARDRQRDIDAATTPDVAHADHAALVANDLD